MKNILLSFFLLLSLSSVMSQEKGIQLKEKATNRTDYLLENKRIKVVTTDGKSLYGRFSIVDNNTISINNTLIPLTSIEKIKRKSLASTIASPFVCAFGVILILGGTAVSALSGSFTIVGLGVISAGFALPLVALISNKHPKNQWEYATIEIPSN